DLAGFQSRRNVDNELYILQSRRLMMEVVSRLGLTTSYTTNQGLQTVELYKSSPVEVAFVNADPQYGCALTVTPLDENEFEATAFEDRFSEGRVSRQKITGNYGDTISTPVGKLVVTKTPYLDSTSMRRTIAVGKRSLEATATSYRKAVQSSIVNKQASVVGISMNSASPRKAEDVINTLITVYNEDGIRDKQSISKVTAEFIASRLEVIGSELGDVDRNIASFKQSNRIVDLQSEASRSVGESSKYKAESLALENQITVAEYIRTYLQDNNNAHELIPMVASISNSGISAQIDEYNTAILQRQKLLQNSSERSPVIQELNTLLSATRHSIIASLSSHISTLEMQRNTMRKEETLANSRISSMPSQEMQMLDVARQQKIKEELFLYLLNKQEENQLNFVIAEPNSRIIDTAYGPAHSIAPRRLVIMCLALLLGLAIPFGLFFLIGLLDTSIRGRRDIETYTTVPFLGDIPTAESSAISRQGVAVRETGRDAISEAFRVLRSNMSFMGVSSGKAGQLLQTILFTSSNPHAGKTFVATNLAMTLAMAGKKVVVVDLDLRRHAFSTQMGHGHSKRGVTSYLSGACGMEQIIENSGTHANFDVIYAGIQPPNPAEILLSERLD
ncbi:MAG: chromosome partitioning protein ParA, partial [Alistipes sp.]|nr:chromosome partitioning protein ParA [Alistipes sp.]